MNTTIAEFEQWIKTPREDAGLEFKEAKNQYDRNKLYGYCVAIANEGGGKFILGVSDPLPRQVVGSKAFPDTHKIARGIFAKLSFRVDVEELLHPSGRVVIFHIPSRPMGTVYSLDGAYLMRSTEDLTPMSEDRLRQIFAEGKPDWFSQEAKNGCSPDDIIQLLDTQSYFDLMKLSYPTIRDSVLERFERENLIVRKGADWTITNMGAILFAKNLEVFDSTSRKAPRVIVYSGIDKTQTRLDKFKTKGYVVGFESFIEFITEQIPTNEVIRKALRDEIKMFPESAIREIIANALIHQDITDSSTFITVELYVDRMEISNPGKPSVPPDRFIDEYKSRNERLAGLMRRLGVCEEKGSGVDKVIKAVEAYQLPAPDFRGSAQRTHVILFAQKSFQDMDRNDRVRACYQHCCLCYVMNQKMTNQSLRERFGLSKSKSATVSQIITATIDEGHIKLDAQTISSTRYNRYIPFWA